MRIWFDVLTPKQVLFFGPMAARLSKRHRVLCTSRRYREAGALARAVGFRLREVGRHGGGGLGGKLDASIARMRLLSPLVQRFRPDLLVSLCSPEASRVAYGLGVRHVAFSDAPFARAAMTLSMPTADRLLVPWMIPKSAFPPLMRRRDIVHYRALDPAYTVRHAPAGPRPPLDPSKRTILMRMPESQAAYMPGEDRSGGIARALAGAFPRENLLVLARYGPQARGLRRGLGRRARVLEMKYDGRALLEAADAFVGSGGTMTAEAALMGVPTISYRAIPGNPTERYLVRRGLALRRTSPGGVAAAVRAALDAPRAPYRRRARRELASMEDPYRALVREIRSVLGRA